MKKTISLLLALCMMLSLVTVAGAETIFENISFDGQGNSKTFVEYGKTDYDYIKFVDYLGISSDTGNITDATSYKPSAVLYAPDGILQDTAIAFDDDGNWVVEGIPSKVNVKEKGIKIQKVSAEESSLSDIMKAQIDSTSIHSVTVKPAKYSRIYLFATTLWSNPQVEVTVTYADNTKETKTITVMQKPYPDFQPYGDVSVQQRNEKGYTVTRPSESTGSSEGQAVVYYHPYCVTTNPNKEVTRIGFKALSRVSVSIISLTGVKPDADDIISYAKSVGDIDAKTYEINKFFPQQANEVVKDAGKDASVLDELDTKIKAYEEANGIVAETTPVEKEEEPKPQTPTVKGEMNFTDLDSVAWAKDAIKYLYDNNIASGTSDTTFSPNEHLTREQFVKIICGAFSVPESTEAVAFKDVKKGQWYEPFVKNAFGAGLVGGVSSDTFGVGQKITRQDLAVIIYRAVGDKIKANGKVPAFSDKADIDGYAAAAVTVLSKAGIINGSDGKFNPKNYCTRAEMAKIVYGVITNIGEGATK